jgi:hypothetical protein
MSAPTVAPAAYTIAGFCAAYGVGRTFTYAEVKAGRLRLVKAGNRTLIGAAEAQRWFDNLPAARRMAVTAQRLGLPPSMAVRNLLMPQLTLVANPVAAQERLAI